MDLKLAPVFFWMNPLVILFFVEVGSSMKVRQSIRSRKTESYLPRSTIPAEGGLFRIRNPFRVNREQGSMSWEKNVEHDKRYEFNGTLIHKSQTRKSRYSETINEMTTKTGITSHDGTATAVPDADKHSIEKRVFIKRTKTAPGNEKSNNIMKGNSSDSSSQVTGEASIQGDGKSNQMLSKGLAQKQEGAVTITKGDMEANLAVPVKNLNGDTDISGGLGTGKVTEVQGDGSAAITAQQEVTSIYIGHSNYTFVAAIHTGVDGKPSFDDVICTGGILSQTVVVTSCSCLYRDNWPVTPFYKLYYVSVGHVPYGSIEGTQRHIVEHLHYHPSCSKRDDGIWLGDIAMVVVARPIKFSSMVQPMKLPNLTMWDASDILEMMSAQRRHCRIIGWSARAPMVDTAIGELIPLDECANPVCKAKRPCPLRTKVDGFMVEITPNEPYLLPGALLFCSEHVFAVVNTKRQCTNNHVFAACSPEELLFTKLNFQLEGLAQKEMLEYNGVLRNNFKGWETYKYRTLTTSTTTSTPGPIEYFDSSASILFPFYIYRETSWIFVHILSSGYYLFVQQV